MIPWWNIVIPQFHSIIPCEVLLYIEVTFLDLSIDMGIFWGSWVLHKHKIPHPNQWGSIKNHKKYFHNRMLCRYFHVFAQYRFGKFFKAQLWENAHNVINSTVRSDIPVFNCYLCCVSFLLTCYVCSTKIDEISDISKYFEDFVSQTLGVLTRIYAAELRRQIKA